MGNICMGFVSRIYVYSGNGHQKTVSKSKIPQSYFLKTKTNFFESSITDKYCKNASFDSCLSKQRVSRERSETPLFACWESPSSHGLT